MITISIAIGIIIPIILVILVTIYFLVRYTINLADQCEDTFSRLNDLEEKLQDMEIDLNTIPRPRSGLRETAPIDVRPLV